VGVGSAFVAGVVRAGAEELGHGLEGGVLGDLLRAEVDGELARVPRGDAVDAPLVLGVERLPRLERLGDPRAVDGVAAHEALAVLRDRAVGGLLRLRLEGEKDHHRLRSEGRIRREARLDRVLGGEGVQVAGVAHGVAPLGVGWCGCPPRDLVRGAPPDLRGGVGGWRRVLLRHHPHPQIRADRAGFRGTDRDAMRHASGTGPLPFPVTHSLRQSPTDTQILLPSAYRAV
jgi:hypothetical protein